jgi:cytochrome c553
MKIKIFLAVVGLGGALSVAALEADLDNGLDIHEVCATCHGEYSQGGKQGEYPRMAGQPAGFIENQLRLFRARARTNMAMLPHTEERELSDQDITDVSAYIATLHLPTQLPLIDENASDFDALQRLQDAKKVLNIPRAEGDIDAGEKLYQRECRSCHGEQGKGKADQAVPMLAGQYTNYLWRQVAKYINKERIHDPDAPEDEELLAAFTETELRDIFAYMSVCDD